MNHLSLTHLATFATVIAEGGVVAAARRLMYSQSSVSAHVRSLEHGLGVALVDRSGTRPRLTAAGQRLALLAPPLLSYVEYLEASVRAPAGPGCAEVPAPPGCGPPRAAVDEHLARVRRDLRRLEPVAAREAALAGALLVDTRTEAQRRRFGAVPGALVVDRTVLEWRLDPTSGHCLPEARRGALVVVLCQEGYSSSLAAASLRGLGVDATDVVGGVEGWVAAGLPVHLESVPPPTLPAPVHLTGG